jgi:carboxylesterase
VTGSNRPSCIEAFQDHAGERGGVLLIHGFTGSPHEMRPLLEPLVQRRYSVIGVRLPGHGYPGTREQIARDAWELAVERALDELRSRLPGDRIAVCGLSAGALLGLGLATRRPADVGALALLSPAIELPRPLVRLLGLARWLRPLRNYRLTKGVSDIRDLTARAEHPGCDPFPISAFASFDELRLRTRAIVAGVRQPMIIVHAAADRTCTLAGAEWLRHQVGSQDVEMHVLRSSGHVITVDAERQTVAQLVCDFLDRTIGR